MVDEDSLIEAGPCAFDKGFSAGSNQVEINSALFPLYSVDEKKCVTLIQARVDG